MQECICLTSNVAYPYIVLQYGFHPGVCYNSRYRVSPAVSSQVNRKRLMDPALVLLNRDLV